MTRHVERYPLIEDIISGYQRFGTARVLDTPLREGPVAPRPTQAPKRPEVPHTGLSVRALTSGELIALRRMAPTLAAELDQAERLRSSPMRQTSRSIPAGSAAEDVDRLRRRAREVIGEQRATV